MPCIKLVRDKAKQIYDEICKPFVAWVNEVFLYSGHAPCWRTFLMNCFELMQLRNKCRVNIVLGLIYNWFFSDKVLQHRAVIPADF